MIHHCSLPAAELQKPCAKRFRRIPSRIRDCAYMPSQGPSHVAPEGDLEVALELIQWSVVRCFFDLFVFLSLFVFFVEVYGGSFTFPVETLEYFSVLFFCILTFMSPPPSANPDHVASAGR